MKISHNSPVAIHMQIVKQIQNNILIGKYNRDCLLPPIRELAKELRTSNVTVSKAYNELLHLGLITSIKGKGYYVNSDFSTNLKIHQRQIFDNSLRETISSAKIAGLDLNEVCDYLNQKWNDE